MKCLALLLPTRRAPHRFPYVLPLLVPAYALAVGGALCVVGSVCAQEVEVDVLASATALDDPASYASDNLPDSSSDLTFASDPAYNRTNFTLDSTSLSVATLNDLDVTQALTITGSQSLMLNGGSDTVPGSSAGDLLFLASGANLTVNGTGGITPAASGNFNVAGNAQVTINASINDPAGGGGSLTLTKTGTGTLTLAGNNTYTGNLTVSAGTLAITAGSFGVASAPATFIVDGTSAGTTVTLSGAATLATSDTFVGFFNSGTFTQTGGTHTVSNDLFVGVSASGTGTYNLSGGILTTGSTAIGQGGAGNFVQTGGTHTVSEFFELGADGGVGTYSLSGAGSVLQNASVSIGSGDGTNPGTVGIFTQTGGTHTISGSLQLGSGGSGTYNLGGSATLATLSADSEDIGITYFGSVRGAGVFNQGANSTNTVTGFLDLASGTADGTYNLNGGTLTTAAVAAFGGGTSTFNFNGGTLQASSDDPSIYLPFFSGLTAANVRTGGAIIDTQTFSVTIAQALVHDPTAGAPALDGGLTKLGTGTLTLSAVNTYTGPTQVSAGTLVVNGALAGGGSVTVANGATLAGTGTVAGAAEVQAGGTFSPGQLGAGRLTLNSNLTLTGTATAVFTLSNTAMMMAQSTQALVAGQINLGMAATLSVTLAADFQPAVGEKFYLLDDTGTSLVLGSFANAPLTGALFTEDGVTYQINYLDSDPNDPGHTLGNDVSVMVIAVVPEPSTWTLLGLGAVGASVVALRRRRAG